MSDVCEHAPAWFAEMVMSTTSISPGREPDPIEIDPRPCQLCGLKIDQHVMIDDGEGPEFICEETDSYAADIVRQWELDDPRDAWRVTGEAPPPAAIRNSDISGKPVDNSRPYRTPQRVVDAFFFVVRTKNAEGIAEWLSRHPLDEPYLHNLWKQKCSTAAPK